MTAISASMVKDLRERTGAGMMECKKALVEANGDVDEAVTILRKRGIAKAAKRAGKIAAEGVVVTKVSTDNKMAVIVEINCETDFVGRDESFLNFANMVAEEALSAQTSDIMSMTGIEEQRQQLVQKIGENIQVRRAELIEATGCVTAYNHGSRIGVLVALDKDNVALGKDVAMHVAAMNPQSIDESDLDPATIAQERDIFSEQARQSGKPDNIVEKMVEGRIAKFKKEVCLVNQTFIRNPDQTIAQLLSADQASVLAMERFEVGEGIEKEVVDFAEEVRAQVQGD